MPGIPLTAPPRLAPEPHTYTVVGSFYAPSPLLLTHCRRQKQTDGIMENIALWKSQFIF